MKVVYVPTTYYFCFTLHWFKWNNTAQNTCFTEIIHVLFIYNVQPLYLKKRGKKNVISSVWRRNPLISMSGWLQDKLQFNISYWVNSRYQKFRRTLVITSPKSRDLLGISCCLALRISCYFHCCLKYEQFNVPKTIKHYAISRIVYLSISSSIFYLFIEILNCIKQ